MIDPPIPDLNIPRWRTGKRVRLNVYAGDRPVCQCHSEEDALAIVNCVNFARILIQDGSDKATTSEEKMRPPASHAEQYVSRLLELLGDAKPGDMIRQYITEQCAVERARCLKIARNEADSYDGHFEYRRAGAYIAERIERGL